MKRLTNKQKQRDNREQNLILDRIVALYQPKIAREIRVTMRKTAQYYNGQQVDMAGLYAQHYKNMYSIVLKMNMHTAKQFTERTQSQVKKSLVSREQKRLMFGPLTDIAAPIIADSVVSDYINLYMLENITKITKTTKDSIGQIVQAGVAQGLSERKIAKLIYDVAPTKSASRAQTIARTESHGAANASSQAMAQATGVEMMREWVSGQDERTRPDHLNANSQTVSMYQPFIVGGVSLDHPGDYSAGAPSQTINCRCSVIYVPLI